MKSTEIISTENVKPSSPTPHHLQSYKLSRIDLIIPPTIVPLTLYFTNNNHSSHQTTAEELLKNSLSVILTRFYPLAGRIDKDGLSINCNDQGVPFAVATTEIGQTLSDFLKNDDLDLQKLARQLLPCQVRLDSVLGPGSSVAMIKLTRFDCGGFAIGAAFWHKIVDAITVTHFLKCWASCCTAFGSAAGSKVLPVCPNYTAQYLFPQIQEREVEAVPLSLGPGIITKQVMTKCVTRRYIFDADAISTLKSKLSSNIDHPSRVEVVSALIWRCFMIASLANEKSTSIVGHVVDLRRRARPPFAADCFGNLVLSSFASCANIEMIEDNKNIAIYGDLLVEKIRASISKIDGEYIDRVGNNKGFSELIAEPIAQTLSEIDDDDLAGADFLFFTSWCNFGLYDVDFGWGKPLWIASSDHGVADDDEDLNFFNPLVLLMDSSSGDGVEAWVTLDQKYMEIFDNVEELRAVAG